MDRGHRRGLCPVICAVRCRSTALCGAVRADSGEGWATAAPTAREPLSKGRIKTALRRTRIASVRGVSAVGICRSELGAMDGTAETGKAPRVMAAVMIWE